MSKTKADFILFFPKDGVTVLSIKIFTLPLP